MIIQTTDNVLYNIEMYRYDNGTDCAVDLLQFSRPLHLNESETAYQWWGDSGTLHEELDFWESEGYTIEMEVVDND